MHIRWIRRLYSSRRTHLRSSESHTALLVHSFRLDGKVRHKDIYLGSFRVDGNGIGYNVDSFAINCRSKFLQADIAISDRDRLLDAIAGYIQSKTRNCRR